MSIVFHLPGRPSVLPRHKPDEKGEGGEEREEERECEAN